MSETERSVSRDYMKYGRGFTFIDFAFRNLNFVWYGKFAAWKVKGKEQKMASKAFSNMTIEVTLVPSFCSDLRFVGFADRWL